jgi:hypothetical protein
MNNDFAKTLKNYSIIYLPELPSKDIKVEENTVIAIPAEEKDKFKLYTWFENKWVLTTTIYKSDFDLKDLKDIYNDLNNAANKLTKISANTESNEMFLKLSKITNNVLQAMYELADDVIEPFEKTCDAEKDYKRAEQQQEYFEHQLEESLKGYNNEQDGL